MSVKIKRSVYADMFGPTTGDKVRLADTDLAVLDEEFAGDHSCYLAIHHGVMAGHSSLKDGVASARLCPAIHVLAPGSKGVDARDKPGHDDVDKSAHLIGSAHAR